MEHELQRGRSALSDALARGDAATAASLYAGDGRLLTPDAALVSGRGEIEAYWRAGIRLGLASIALDLIELRGLGGTAIEIGRYSLAFAGEVEPGFDAGKYLALHRRQDDGSWKRVADVFNPDGPGVGRREQKEAR
jgi:uncharacterized protein (TIGR02246 family)